MYGLQVLMLRDGISPMVGSCALVTEHLALNTQALCRSFHVSRFFSVICQTVSVRKVSMGGPLYQHSHTLVMLRSAGYPFMVYIVSGTIADYSHTDGQARRRETR